MQRSEKDTGQRYDQCAEPDDDSVDLGLELDPKRLHVSPDKVQILFRRDVVVDRVEPPGYACDGHRQLSPGVCGDPFGLLAVDVGVR